MIRHGVIFLVLEISGKLSNALGVTFYILYDQSYLTLIYGPNLSNICSTFVLHLYNRLIIIYDCRVTKACIILCLH